jgi:riboflavin kinase/FMN adenylyltransferase
MNIGFNPTVSGEQLSVEVHYLDFNADLYGQKMQVSILEYLRSEQKFDSVILLKEQLEKDKQTALNFISEQH